MSAGMLNHGVLDLHAPLPGMRCRPMLTTSVTWLLRVCLLDVMFDENFELHQGYLRGSVGLRDRFRTAAVMSALLSPFILLFLFMHFLLKNLERIYHHPSSLGAPAFVP
jgi:autophagy-related protein 9